MKESNSAANASTKPSTAAKNIAALAGGTISAAAMVGTTDAAIVHVTGTPLNLDSASPSGTTVDWDVDGTGGIEFQLNLNKGGGYTYMQLNSAGNGLGFLNTGAPLGSALKNVTNSNVLAQAVPTGGYGWGAVNANRTVLSQNSAMTSTNLFNVNGITSGNAAQVGFRFTGATGTQYGWASVTITDNNSSINVSEWAYENTGASITIGAVPEPSVSMLGLLAAGAAGLRRRRQKR